MNPITDTSALTNTLVIVSANGYDVGAVIAITVLSLAALMAFVMGFYLALRTPMGGLGRQ